MNPSPENKVVQLPFPTKQEDVRAVHIAELDKRFGDLIRMYQASKVSHINRFNFETIRRKIVDDGGISDEVMRAYLVAKNLSWDE